MNLGPSTIKLFGYCKQFRSITHCSPNKCCSRVAIILPLESRSARRWSRSILSRWKAARERDSVVKCKRQKILGHIISHTGFSHLLLELLYSSTKVVFRAFSLRRLVNHLSYSISNESTDWKRNILPTPMKLLLDDGGCQGNDIGDWFCRPLASSVEPVSSSSLSSSLA